jgi:hypothetical protein
MTTRNVLVRSAALFLTATPLVAQTHVSLRGVGAAGQEHAGMYRRSTGEIRRFTSLPSGVFVTMPWLQPPRQADSTSPGTRIEKAAYDGPYAQFASRNGSQFLGRALFAVKNGAYCRQFAWWAPAKLTITNQSARIETDGRIVDRDTCTLTATPDPIVGDYERFTRVSFVPLARNAYIYRIAVPTQGTYKGVARFRWQYPELEPSSVRLSTRHENGATNRLGTFTGGQGSYEFTAVRPGRYTFVLEVIDRQGEVIHRDKAIAEFP